MPVKNTSQRAEEGEVCVDSQDKGIKGALALNRPLNDSMEVAHLMWRGSLFRGASSQREHGRPPLCRLTSEMNRDTCRGARK